MSNSDTRKSEENLNESDSEKTDISTKEDIENGKNVLEDKPESSSTEVSSAEDNVKEDNKSAHESDTEKRENSSKEDANSIESSQEKSEYESKNGKIDISAKEDNNSNNLEDKYENRKAAISSTEDNSVEDKSSAHGSESKKSEIVSKEDTENNDDTSKIGEYEWENEDEEAESFSEEDIKEVERNLEEKDYKSLSELARIFSREDFKSSANWQKDLDEYEEDSPTSEKEDLEISKVDSVEMGGPTTSEMKLFLKEYSSKEKASSPDKPSTSRESQLSPLASTMHFVQKKQKPVKRILEPCNSCELLDPLEIEDTGCFDFFKRRKNMSTISEFWVISVPKEEKTFEDLSRKTNSGNMSLNYKFHIPNLKVETLDILVLLTEQLKTLDKFAEDATKKLCDYIKEELVDKPDAVEKNLEIHDLHPVTFLTRFAWDKTKYPTEHSVREIADLIYTRIEKITRRMKIKLTMFEKVKSKLKKYEHRESDGLQNRYLGDIISKGSLVHSTFLTTLLVIVPNEKVKEWLQSYDKLCDLIVPQSSSKLFQDDTHSLFNVTLCRKKVDDFKKNARMKQFMVREYEISEDEGDMTEDTYYKNLAAIKARELALIFRWTKMKFQECYDAWLHVIALRVLVESVLRFGLHVTYEAILLIPIGSRRKLKKILDKLYKNVDVSLSEGHMEEVPGALAIFDVQDFSPYVFLKINLEFMCSKMKK